MERQQSPNSLHCTILPHHVQHADKFLTSLRQAVDTVWGNKALSKKGTAGIYGMVGKIPDKAVVDDFLVQFFTEVYTSK